MDPLRTDHLIADLRTRTFRGVGATATAQALKFVAHITSIIFLSRLLSPSDFGLVATAAAMTMILNPLVGEQLGNAVIQKHELTSDQASWLFIINIFLGFLILASFTAASGFISDSFDTPRLQLILIAFSASFVLTAVGTLPEAILLRQMRFKAVASIDVVSVVTGVVVAITAATLGAGLWALVLLNLTPPAIRATLSFFCCNWRPTFPKSARGVRGLVRFSAHLTGASLLGSIHDNLLVLVLGRATIPEAIGYFNRANAIVSVPSTQLLPPLIKVAQPSFSRLSAEPERLTRATLQLMNKVTIAAMFVTTITFVCAGDIVQTFLGEGWDDAVPYMQYLALLLLTQPSMAALATGVQAAGASEIILKSKLLNLPITIIALLIGSAWGPLGAVAAYALSGPFARLPVFIILARSKIRLGLRDIFRIYGASLTMGAVVGTFTMGARHLVSTPPGLISLIIWTSLGLIIYVAMGMLFRETRETIKNGIKELVKLAGLNRARS